MSRLSDALALLMKPDDSKREKVTPMISVEAMMEQLGQHGEVTVTRMSRGGWWAYMSINNGPAELKIKGASGLPTVHDAVTDLHTKATRTLRLKL